MKKQHHYGLKRELGFWELTLSGIGIILGAGIYALIGKAAGVAGNGIWLSFLISALLAALTGLSYAEFSSMFPKAGAEYVYTKRSFGNLAAFVIGWLVIFSGVIGASTVALGFAGYATSLFATPLVPVALLLIMALSFIIFWGIKQSTRLAVVFTLIEGAGLIIIIAIGLPHLGSVNYFEFPSVASVFSAAALIFFAFIGFEEMVRLSEETKRPSRTVPRALLTAIAVTTIFYILVALSAVSILSPAELAASSSPMADVAARVLGPQAFLLIAVIALFSTSNTVLLMLLAASRITYGIAKDRCMPALLARVHPRRRTPHIAIALVMVLALIGTVGGDIHLVASITDFTIYVTFVAINLGVIAMRYRAPRQRRAFRIPGSIGRLPVIPLLGAITSFTLMLSLSFQTLLFGVLLTFAGFVFYRILVKEGICKPEAAHLKK
ncbi:MAG: amino acid permease [Candidatus Aenigmarchaeota archaeon]|nr:amino acid permease [Candidatus Aenigmarchaeota archaeon]